MFVYKHETLFSERFWLVTDCWISNVNTFWLYFVEKKFKVQKENITENALHSHEKCSAPLSWSIDRITLRPVIFIISCVCILINRLLVKFRNCKVYLFLYAPVEWIYSITYTKTHMQENPNPMWHSHVFEPLSCSKMQFKVLKYSFWLKVFGTYDKAHHQPPFHMAAEKLSLSWNWHVSFMLNPFNFKMCICCFYPVPLDFRRNWLTHILPL